MRIKYNRMGHIVSSSLHLYGSGFSPVTTKHEEEIMFNLIYGCSFGSHKCANRTGDYSQVILCFKSFQEITFKSSSRKTSPHQGCAKLLVNCNQINIQTGPYFKTRIHLIQNQTSPFKNKNKNRFTIWLRTGFAKSHISTQKIG